MNLIKENDMPESKNDADPNKAIPADVNETRDVNDTVISSILSRPAPTHDELSRHIIGYFLDRNVVLVTFKSFLDDNTYKAMSKHVATCRICTDMIDTLEAAIDLELFPPDEGIEVDIPSRIDFPDPKDSMSLGPPEDVLDPERKATPDNDLN